MQEKLVKKQSLNGADLAEIGHLAETCNLYDDINLKLNWEMMKNRDTNQTDQTNDFCYYSNETLVGYVPLDGFGDKFEITGAVLPEYRRKGIFRRLLNEAVVEAKKYKPKELLLVGYRAAIMDAAVAKASDATYTSSEYHMEAHANNLPALAASQLQLIQAEPHDLGQLSRLLAATFGSDEWNSHDKLAKDLQRPNSRYWLARLEDKIIGQIGAIVEENGVYIRAVGIEPAYQGKGYGRQLLAAILKNLLQEGHQHFELDVATENAHALNLYQSCGFRETIIYDYYELKS